ncbi:hypothetical protein LTS10_000174 [Elasticomyces elasticus]|nr:hypothetical protein LTS10_000174 [Elasticomyces elasticus]
MQERNTGIIEHTEFDADTVERMICYIYTQAYCVGGATGAENELAETAEPALPLPVNEVLAAHARVYCIGDYYNLPELRILAIDKFKEAALEGWKLEGFVDVIKEVYRLDGLAHSALRRALRDISIDHITELMQSDSFRGELATLEGAQDFTVDLLALSVLDHNREVGVLHNDLLLAKDSQASTTRALAMAHQTVANERTRRTKNEQTAQTVYQHAQAAIRQLEAYVVVASQGCPTCGKGTLTLENERGAPSVGGFALKRNLRCSKFWTVEKDTKSISFK